jgi:exopolyphosphatase/guanosine-5'-triphosphate,3'-diphosphate pyrophosphatase
MTAVATSPRTVAFMDIGTNSIRLLVVEINPNHSHTVLHQLKETVRLGENEFVDQHLQPQAIDRATAVIRQFASLARSSGADEIVAVATAATREAANQHLFLQRLREEANVEVHVISGLEEARLIHLGVASGLHLEDKQVFCIDIGGGSTEVIVGTQDEHVYLNSLKLGAIRMTTRFLNGVTEPVSPRLYEKIREYISYNAARTIHELQAYRIDVAVGISGTVENLADVAARMYFKRPWQRNDILSYSDLKQAISYLCSLPLEERRNVPGLNPSRADIIIGGAAVLDTLMDELGINEIRVSDRGLREGLLVDYLLRLGHAPFTEGMTVRERSVLQLARTSRFNEAHARTTARLALSLFDSAREAGLHDLGVAERELLGYAAMLHHIGVFLTYNSYQRHSYYLIRHAELLGFDQTEIAIIAATAMYHRGSLPRLKDGAFSALTAHDQATVRVLSMFLRLAETLDRSQTASVQSAGLFAKDATHTVLDVEAGRDCHVELRGLEEQRAAFYQVFGRQLEISANIIELLEEPIGA